MLSLIPIMFTFGNLFSGVVALFFIVNNEPKVAAMLMLLAVVFDYLDGKIARYLHAESKIGEYLDSLSDIISFGVVPTIIIINMSFINLLVALLFIGSSAYRLARFHYLKNLNNKKSNYLGMPITVNGIIVPIIIFTFPSFLIYWLVLASILMVSRLNIKKII